MISPGPQVFVELRPSREGCYVAARIEGALDGSPRTFVGVHASRDEAVSEVTSWALGWLRRFRKEPASAGGGVFGTDRRG